MKAVYNYDLSSGTMREGLIRNGSVLLVVWSLFFITPSDFDVPLTVITTGFIASHFISVFENLHDLNVKIPNSVMEKLRNYEESLYDEGDYGEKVNEEILKEYNLDDIGKDDIHE